MVFRDNAVENSECRANAKVFQSREKRRKKMGGIPMATPESESELGIIDWGITKQLQLPNTSVDFVARKIRRPN